MADADVEDGGRKVLASGVGFLGTLLVNENPLLVEDDGEEKENGDPDPNADIVMHAVAAEEAVADGEQETVGDADG